MNGEATKRSAIDRLVAGRADAGFFFDFDGVLSPIQDDAAAARALPEAKAALAELCKRLPRVAIISSRPASFMVDVLGDVELLGIHGSYGLQSVVDGEIVLADEVPHEWPSTVAALLDEARQEFSDDRFEGVQIEDKDIAIGLHYRLAKRKEDSAAALAEWAESVAARNGGVAVRGRDVIELKVRSNIDKGSTLEAISAGLSTAWFFGDDLGDVSAFDNLIKRRSGDDGFDGVCVGIANDNVVAAVRDRADMFLASPTDVADLLVEVNRRLDAG